MLRGIFGLQYQVNTKTRYKSRLYVFTKIKDERSKLRQRKKKRRVGEEEKQKGETTKPVYVTRSYVYTSVHLN